MILASRILLWQHHAMIEFRTLSDAHPDLAHSPLLRAALLTLRYAQDDGAIGLTKTKAFKRVFVHWAVENFGWPGKSAEQMFLYSKVINEFEFPPLEFLHYLLITLRLGSSLSAGCCRLPHQLTTLVLVCAPIRARRLRASRWMRFYGPKSRRSGMTTGRSMVPGKLGGNCAVKVKLWRAALSHA